VKHKKRPDRDTEHDAGRGTRFHYDKRNGIWGGGMKHTAKNVGGGNRAQGLKKKKGKARLLTAKKKTPKT